MQNGTCSLECWLSQHKMQFKINFENPHLSVLSLSLLFDFNLKKKVSQLFTTGPLKHWVSRTSYKVQFYCSVAQFKVRLINPFYPTNTFVNKLHDLSERIKYNVFSER